MGAKDGKKDAEMIRLCQLQKYKKKENHIRHLLNMCSDLSASYITFAIFFPLYYSLLCITSNNNNNSDNNEYSFLKYG